MFLSTSITPFKEISFSKGFIAASPALHSSFCSWREKALFEADEKEFFKL
jgi:hypothetical protein